MPDYRRANCRKCERHRNECGPISWLGNCTDCAKTAVSANVEGLMLKREPELGRWRRGMAASVGAVLVDDHNSKGVRA